MGYFNNNMFNRKTLILALKFRRNTDYSNQIDNNGNFKYSNNILTRSYTFRLNFNRNFISFLQVMTIIWSKRRISIKMISLFGVIYRYCV